ncbi:MAG: MBL fold metallo-hydrolase [Acidimicrobiales bacterium]|nr:MBL fold metallo-hydrolase [Acidimicrobiales bacterium]HRW38377.1 MBL fold metallo-hydrolase [Aquihabitans sp.]
MAEIGRIHHLDCCTMCPVLASKHGHHLVAHVLAIETERAGIVLVDTGIGDRARQDLKGWLGGPFVAAVRPDADPARSARAQLEALGLDPRDVRHVLVTHLDLDHAGGLADFPDAQVHVHLDELAAARHPSWRERSRYRQVQWAHGPRWTTYERAGEAWFGFDAAHALDGLPDDIVAIPLAGHTRGHAAIAVRGDDGWLLHAGDAYFQAHTVHPEVPAGPPVIRRFEQVVAVDRQRVARNHERLAELARDHGGEVTVFSAHDAGELERLRSRR